MKTKANIKSVIVGIDFSKNSKVAFRYAKSIANKLKAKLVLVHICNDHDQGPWEYVEDKQYVIAQHTDAIRKHYRPKKEDAIVVKSGHRIFSEIIAITKKFPKPMIVVADQGIGSKLGRLILGSTAERLALHSPFPLIVHKGKKTTYPKKVLIPFDFSRRSEHAVVGTQNLGLKDTQLEFYHVRQWPVPVMDYQGWQFAYEATKQSEKLQIERFKQKYKPIKVTETESNDISGSIEKRGKKFDAIVISPREHKGMFSSFGSVTSKLVRASGTSVLVIP